MRTKGAANKKEYAVDSHAETEKVQTVASGGGTAKIKVQRKKKSKAVTDVLHDQLVDLKDAIGQVALKDSKFNRQGEIGKARLLRHVQSWRSQSPFIGSLYSARRLARHLFSSLSAVYPPRSHLLVEGKE